MRSDFIPLADPGVHYRMRGVEIDKSICRVLESGRYILNREVQAFEEEFASYIGAKYGVGVGSGTAALHLALRACKIGKGDEVITVSHTASATVSAIELAGAVPVLVDIDPNRYTLDPEKLSNALSARTKAIVPVHLYGSPADIESICEFANKHGLVVIEDCAQAHGAKVGLRRVGCFGQLGCFSFYPTKNLGALGDGGAVVTEDPVLDARLRLLRQYGWKERFVSQIGGMNSRLDEIQAAVLRVKLAYLDRDNQIRVELAGAYSTLLSDSNLILPKRHNNTKHVYHLYVVRSADREGLLHHLHQNGVGADVHYPTPIHRQSAYVALEARDLCETERISREILSLPLYPGLGKKEVERVADIIRGYSR